MADCYPYERTIDSTTFTCTLDVDHYEVCSHRYLEIPVSGPGLANCLVIVAGLAAPRLDVDFANVDVQSSGLVLVETDYRLKEADQWENIANNKDVLIQTTNASLAALENSEHPFIYAVNDAWSTITTDGRVQINIGVTVAGEIVLAKISYQACILIHRAK